MSRKGRTGLEWLLEKEKPPQGADEGSAGAAVPENAAASAPPPAAPGDVDAALAELGLEVPPPAPKVLSRMPAEASLAHETDREEAAPSTNGNGAGKPRSADGLANALLREEKPAPAKEEKEKPDEKPAEPAAEAKPAAAAAEAKPADDTKPAPVADAPQADTSIAAAPESWQTARTGKMKGVVRTQGEEIAAREVDEPADDASPAAAGDEPSASFDSSIAAEEPSVPPPSVEDPLGAVTERHKKAVSSGRSTRAHPRAKAVFDVKYKKANEPVTGKGRNVSLGGFFVETTKQLPEGEVFSAQLFFDQRKLSVIAEVMWQTMGDPDDLDRFPPGVGCKFLDIDERDVPFLKGVIDASLSTGGAVP